MPLVEFQTIGDSSRLLSLGVAFDDPVADSRVISYHEACLGMLIPYYG